LSLVPHATHLSNGNGQVVTYEGSKIFTSSWGRAIGMREESRGAMLSS